LYFERFLVYSSDCICRKKLSADNCLNEQPGGNPMKSVWSLFAAIALSVGCVGAVQAGEPSPAVLEAAIFTLPGDHVPMTLETENPVAFAIPTAGVCQPGTFQRYCKEIWGVSQGRCGASTWRWTSCQQFRDPAGKWYYQYCGPVQETCTAPGGAECIPCL
jgi:hypothetical protein